MAAVIADSTAPFRYHGKLPDRARTREPPRIQILTGASLPARDLRHNGDAARMEPA
jgi:hypothetical protein